jgi:hypothetical protein
MCVQAHFAVQVTAYCNGIAADTFIPVRSLKIATPLCLNHYRVAIPHPMYLMIVIERRL